MTSANLRSMRVKANAPTTNNDDGAPEWPRASAKTSQRPDVEQRPPEAFEQAGQRVELVDDLRRLRERSRARTRPG